MRHDQHLEPSEPAILSDCGDAGSVAATGIDRVARHDFINRLRILISLDRYEVPFLDGPDWHKFRTDPFRFLMRSDDLIADAIWDAVERRADQLLPWHAPVGMQQLQCCHCRRWFARPAGASHSVCLNCRPRALHAARSPSPFLPGGA